MRNLENILILIFSLNFLTLISSLQIEADIFRSTEVLEYDWEYQWNAKGDFLPLSTIPHDFSIIQKFDEKNEAEGAFLPGGLVLYRKYLDIPKIKQKFKAFLYFYGAYKDSYISVNDKYIGENHYGYNSFSFDITDELIADGKTENYVDVKVEHETPSSRWYSGSGLLRNVELIITNPLHFALDGVKITTPYIDSNNGTVQVESEIINEDSIDKIIKVNLVIKDKNKKIVAINSDNNSEIIKIKKNQNKVITSEIIVDDPLLWSDIEPNLYFIDVEIISLNEDDEEEIIVDRYSTKFGFRYYSFSKRNGFFLNGVPKKMHGVSIHHDYGALGGIDSYDAARKRFLQLKDMGINAIRTTHNTPHKTWPNLCDELGILVIEEIFDGWNYTKNGNEHDISQYFGKAISKKNKIIDGKEGMLWVEYIVKRTIKRDRNNPSIIMWSLGNEVGVDENSSELIKNMILWGREIDNNRIYTLGDNEVYKNMTGVRLSVDDMIVTMGGIVGYNYGDMENVKEGIEHFGIIYLLESGSALNSRGVYSLIENGDKKKHDGNFHLTSYDTSYPPSYGALAHTSLIRVLKHDYLSGQFVWTGYDYLGEPAPWNGGAGSKTGRGAIPNTAYYGIIDTANFPKDSYYLYRAQLNKNSYTLHLVTAWDRHNIYFVDEEENKTPVHVYTNVPIVEIYRNDISEPICRLTKKTIKTDMGFEYYIYKSKSLNDTICDVVPPSDEDEGSELFARFNIEFKRDTKLYAKGFSEDNEEINDKEIVGKKIAGEPNKKKLLLEVKSDKNVLKSNEKNLAFIEVSIVDDTGLLNTKGENVLSFTLEGEGKIIGVDNGDQATVDKFQQESVLFGEDYAVIKAYAGKALVIVSSKRKSGKIWLTVSSEGFDDKEIEIKVE